MERQSAAGTQRVSRSAARVPVPRAPRPRAARGAGVGTCVALVRGGPTRRAQLWAAFLPSRNQGRSPWRSKRIIRETERSQCGRGDETSGVSRAPADPRAGTGTPHRPLERFTDSSIPGSFFHGVCAVGDRGAERTRRHSGVWNLPLVASLKLRPRLEPQCPRL